MTGTKESQSPKFMTEIITNMKKVTSNCLAVMNAAHKLRSKSIRGKSSQNLIEIGNWKIIVEGISRSEVVVVDALSVLKSQN